jgi:hypothetical protein
LPAAGTSAVPPVTTTRRREVWESGRAAGAWRPPRLWTNVPNAALIRVGDVFTYVAVDGEWRDGTVLKRALDAGRDVAWWLAVHRWEDGQFELGYVLVERHWNGMLHELPTDDDARPT